MPEAVICSAARTPVGSFGGAFREFSALDLGVAAARAPLERTMGLGPTVSTPKALAKAGLQIGDIDLIEFNEVFAAQIIACQRDMGFDFARCNVNGGAIALGHPIGATGVRLMVTLLHELRRSDKQFGLATMCVGGGQGASIVIENVR